MVGAFTPSVPVDHQHVALAAVEGHELPREMPCFRDLDNLVYGKSEAGGILFGGYEPNPVARWADGVPWDHAGVSVPPDHERFAQLMDGAVRRFPFLRDAGVVALICHPDAMTPDGNPLLGPMPGVPGFWTAAGLSLNGFGGAGGIGKTVAEWITDGGDRARRDRLPRLALRRVVPRSALRAGDGPRGLPLLLPPPLPVRRRRVGQAEAALAPARTARRISARSSGRRTGGSARTSSSRGSRAGGPEPTSGRSGSRSRPGSSGSAWSTRPSASASGSST